MLLRGNNKSAFTGIQCGTDEAAKRIEQESVSLIELYEVFRFTHLGPIYSRRGIQRAQVVRAPHRFVKRPLIGVVVDQYCLR